MPRRNQRAESETVLAKVLLGDDYKFTRDPEEAERRRQARKDRAAAASKRSAESYRATWTRCVVPGCKFQVPKQLRNGGGIEFPVCTPHAVAVWMDVEQRSDDPGIQETTAALRARRQVIADEYAAAEAEFEASYQQRYAAGLVDGDIYFIRANGLIKVGWSSNLESRLKSYGPNIEILCVYPGTRQDETTLHRQLKPSRAKGREWYHEDDILQDFIAQAIAKHGAAKIVIPWSAPSAVVASKRTSRR